MPPPAAGDELQTALAALSGIEAPTAARPVEELGAAIAAGQVRAAVTPRPLLRVAELITLGVAVVLAACATLSARFTDTTLPVHPIPLAAWAVAAGITALALAALVSRPEPAQHVGSRAAATGLTLALLAALAGVVTEAGGASGPAWVLYLPVVIVVGAVARPAAGLLVGAGAAAGVYAAALASHTLTTGGLGRLVILLPSFPAAGLAAAALAAAARAAAESAHRTREALERDVAQLSDLLELVAEGDLTVVPSPSGSDPVTTALAVTFADTLLALRRLVRQLAAGSDQLSSAATQLAAGAEQQAAAASEQGEAVAQTTSTIEELAAAAEAIAETAVRVSRYAGATRVDVEQGAEAVEATSLAMATIAARVTQLAGCADEVGSHIDAIARSTQVIDELARRTAMLAVSAAIEAANAGEHGAGFTHVASEVATLAGRAREATSRITAIVADLRQHVAATAEAAADGDYAVAVGEARQQDVVAELGQIAVMVDRTTAAAREITEATRQQRYASTAVVDAMASVSSASERYAAGSHRHAVAAGRLRDLAERVSHTVSGFKVSHAQPRNSR